MYEVQLQNMFQAWLSCLGVAKAQTFSLGNMPPHIVPFVFSYAGGLALGSPIGARFH
jgi:hypothetical protein